MQPVALWDLTPPSNIELQEAYDKCQIFTTCYHVCPAVLGFITLPLPPHGIIRFGHRIIKENMPVSRKGIIRLSDTLTL